MNKLFAFISLSLILQQTNNILASRWQADNWYNRYNNYYNANSLRQLMTEYSFCRVQELNAWLKQQRKDLDSIEYEIANEEYNNALRKKSQLETKIKSYYNGYAILKTIRDEGHNVANEKFANEMLTHYLVHYKSGKIAAAKTSKRNFFFHCYRNLKNGYSLWR